MLKNVANSGGGTSISSTFSTSYSVYINFYHCIWKSNRATYGPALDLIPITIVIKDCYPKLDSTILVFQIMASNMRQETLRASLLVHLLLLSLWCPLATLSSLLIITCLPSAFHQLRLVLKYLNIFLGKSWY